MKCFKCGVEGHMLRDCPYRQPKSDEHEASGGRRVGNMALEEQKGETTTARQKEIEELRRRLQQAELSEAIQTVGDAGALNVVQSVDGGETPRLGPTVWTPIQVNGFTTDALVDTGSPATIVSLKFILEVLRRERTQGQTNQQWQDATRKKFTDPDVTLKSYGGFQLHFMAQIELLLTRGNYQAKVTALVRKDAPNDLLIGTDVQPKLGFALLVKEEDGGAIDLFSGQEASLCGSPPSQISPSECVVPGPRYQDQIVTSVTQPQDETVITPDQCPSQTLPVISPDDSQSSPMTFAYCGETDDRGVSQMVPEVRLLQAVRIPAGHQKLVRAGIDGSVGGEALLLTPGELGQTLRLADGVVQIDDDQFVTLVVENHGAEKTHLKKGTQLGTLAPVDILTVMDGKRKPEDLTAVVDAGADGNREGAISSLTSSPTDNAQNEGAAEETKDCLQVTKTQSVAEPNSVGGARNSAQVRFVECDPPSDARVADLFSQLDWNISHLTDEEQRSLKSLLASYSDVFALNPSELGTTQLVTHFIDTGSSPPVKQQVRRTPFALREKVDQLVEEMLDLGVIEASESPWASPIVLVQKKNGEMRFCVDYRKLNRITKLDEFPLPRIDDTLDQLTGSRHFSTLDLASGYWQIAMDSESKEKTAFTTYSGLFQFRKMPFGLVNAPATFQRLMEVVLAGLARKVCVVYLDDILVFGRTLTEHNANLGRVLERIRMAGLRLKPRKCHFALEEVEYLHLVSTDGVRTDPKKLRAVEEFPIPPDLKTLRSFLGLASYYRKFVPGFAKVAGPLHALTRKDVPFLWTSECQSAFVKLKALLTSAPVLAYPDFSEPFVLETDASGAGLGAVLAQRQEDNSIKPIAYASRSLQPHEKNYGITELEGLGVVWAVKHFRPYLYGHTCDVYTDHAALTSLLNTPQPSGKLARWGMAIQELDLHMHHRSGKTNANADALSRSPLFVGKDLSSPDTEGVIAAVEVEADLPACQRQDQNLAAIIHYLETGILPSDERLARSIALSASQYVLEDDVLYRVEQDSTLRVIPPTDQRERLFWEAHRGVFDAHLSDVKVHSELRRHYWWDGMRRDITAWTRGCVACNSHALGRAVHPPLTPIPVGGPFDRIGVDVIQYPRSRLGNQYAVVFVDYLTKWPEVYAVPDQTAATIANLLVQ